jgi:hypothetical protein
MAAPVLRYTTQAVPYGPLAAAAARGVAVTAAPDATLPRDAQPTLTLASGCAPLLPRARVRAQRPRRARGGEIGADEAHGAAVHAAPAPNPQRRRRARLAPQRDPSALARTRCTAAYAPDSRRAAAPLALVPRRAHLTLSLHCAVCSRARAAARAPQGGAGGLRQRAAPPVAAGLRRRALSGLGSEVRAWAHARSVRRERAAPTLCAPAPYRARQRATPALPAAPAAHAHAHAHAHAQRMRTHAAHPSASASLSAFLRSQ